MTFPQAGNDPSQTTWLPAGVKQLMLPSLITSDSRWLQQANKYCRLHKLWRGDSADESSVLGRVVNTLSQYKQQKKDAASVYNCCICIAMQCKHTWLSQSRDTTAYFNNPRSSVQGIISFRSVFFFYRIRFNSVSQMVACSYYLTRSRLKDSLGHRTSPQAHCCIPFKLLQHVFLILFFTNNIYEIPCEVKYRNSILPCC